MEVGRKEEERGRIPGEEIGWDLTTIFEDFRIFFLFFFPEGVEDVARRGLLGGGFERGGGRERVEEID